MAELLSLGAAVDATLRHDALLLSLPRRLDDPGPLLDQVERLAAALENRA